MKKPPILSDDKFILDACCGPRMIWFNKKHPNALYIDIKEEEPGYITNRKFREVKPDVIMDFRSMDLPDNHFKLVVWDPPHRTDFGKNSLMYKNYGILPEMWPGYLKKGFSECWRVLQDYGILIFKWNEKEIKLKRVLELFPVEPLFGHHSGRNDTHWLTFMKIPGGSGS